MTRRGVLALALAVGPAIACERIQYVEVKDWKPEAIVAAYCADYHEALRITEEGHRATSTSRVNPAIYLSMINVCSEQMGMYARALKNLHGREMPPCPPK
jgi:hypothetical protein